MVDFIALAVQLAAVATAVVAGVFFAFSSFVMPALARLAPSQGIAAMQSINITAVRPAFMALLFGTALLTAALAIARLGDPLVITAASIYLVGVIGVTAAAHVPRNNSLATLDPHSPLAEQAWRRYVVGWGRWNHVRWIAAAASSAVFFASS